MCINNEIFFTGIMSEARKVIVHHFDRQIHEYYIFAQFQSNSLLSIMLTFSCCFGFNLYHV